VGSSGNDILNGAHSASGGAGNDILAGQNEAGIYDGGAGFDYLDFGLSPYAQGWTVNLSTGVSTNTTVFVDGQIAGIEGVRGSNAPDVLLGDDNANVLDGKGSDDTMNGGGGDDTLIGGNDNDFLEGGAGNDTLNGGTENDTLAGGAGNDVFVFTPGAGLSDVIQDFHMAQPGVLEFDRIDLTAYGHGIVIDLRVDNAGTGTIFTVGGGGHIDSFTVLGVDPGSLHQSDLILA
jgi:Ca2+-binding RTX toxin-like protein